MVAAVVAVGGCAPATSPHARGATYPRPASAVFQAAAEALRDQGYRIAAADPVTGRMISVAQWFSADGLSRAGLLKDRDLRLSIGVRLEADAPDHVTVFVEPLVLRVRANEALLRPVGAAERPGWIDGRVDAVYDALDRHLSSPVPPAP